MLFAEKSPSKGYLPSHGQTNLYSSRAKKKSRVKRSNSGYYLAVFKKKDKESLKVENPPSRNYFPPNDMSKGSKQKYLDYLELFKPPMPKSNINSLPDSEMRDGKSQSIGLDYMELFRPLSLKNQNILKEYLGANELPTKEYYQPEVG